METPHGGLIVVLDVFEVVMLVGACFLINYITADSRTNWAEGYTLISFYVIIVSARGPWKRASENTKSATHN